jgi:hypothetical protein
VLARHHLSLPLLCSIATAHRWLATILLHHYLIPLALRVTSYSRSNFHSRGFGFSPSVSRRRGCHLAALATAATPWACAMRPLALVLACPFAGPQWVRPLWSPIEQWNFLFLFNLFQIKFISKQNLI